MADFNSRVPQSEKAKAEKPAAIALTSMRVGDRGTLAEVDLLDDEVQILNALGLGPSTELKLCKAGNPWILQARGTRIGLADDVARRLRVTPTP